MQLEPGPSPAGPNREIHLFGAGVDSGTYDYFTEAIVGKEGASRGDFTSSEDDNVLVQGVSSDELALGFLPLRLRRAEQDKLKLVPVDDGKAENGNGPIMLHGRDRPQRHAISRCRARSSSTSRRKAADRPEVQKFVESYFGAAALMREVGYVELTPQIYDLAKEALRRAQGRHGVRRGRIPGRPDPRAVVDARAMTLRTLRVSPAASTASG